MQSLADYMPDTVNGKTAAEQPLRLSPVRAMAAVGAVNELVLLAIESNQWANRLS
ncbi:MAG: hypothetical protein R3E42_01490 [Burkholderiaceae bacterium]